MIPRVHLVTYDVPVEPMPGMFFSTDPHSAVGENGVSYIVKDTDLDVVFAEISGLSLAREAGLPVPDAAACVWNDNETYAGSSLVSGIRLVDPWLTQPTKVVNYDRLFDLVVVDIWLANWDRNIGSILGMPAGNGNVSLVFIDFEKSVTLRPNPLVQAPLVEPRLLWPSSLLGRILRERRPPRPPQGIIDHIRNIGQERCEAIINEAITAIYLPVAWGDNSAQALAHRARNIQTLAETVWTT
jgi:hypothetical protein